MSNDEEVLKSFQIYLSIFLKGRFLSLRKFDNSQSWFFPAYDRGIKPICWLSQTGTQLYYNLVAPYLWRQAGEHLQQGWVGWGMAQLPCFCQLDGVLPLQLFVEKHNAWFGLVVFSEQELLQIFAVEILQPVWEQSKAFLASCPLFPNYCGSEHAGSFMVHSCPILYYISFPAFQKPVAQEASPYLFLYIS